MRTSSGTKIRGLPDADAGASTAPRPLIVRIRREPFWGTIESVALCPGALGKPRRRTSGFSKSIMTKPLTYRDVVSDTAAAAWRLRIETAGSAVVVALRTLRNSRRFIVGSFL